MIVKELWVQERRGQERLPNPGLPPATKHRPYAIINGMTLRIDKAGRIVLTKPLRERLGLRTGMDLEVAECADCLTLKPVSEKTAMVREKGFWVHQGVASKGFDWNRQIEDDREERNRQVSRRL